MLLLSIEMITLKNFSFILFSHTKPKFPSQYDAVLLKKTNRKEDVIDIDNMRKTGDRQKKKALINLTNSRCQHHPKYPERYSQKTLFSRR